MTAKNFANIYRPKNFSEMAGQKELVSQNGILPTMLQNGLQSSIFFGPAGTGKTTSAYILSEKSNMPIEYINGVTFSTTDLKNIIKTHTKQFLLYLDEIQYLNKKQQQTLLPFIENETFILIASTTDNPYFAIHEAVLSRCIVLEFKPLSSNAIYVKLKEIQNKINRLNIEDEVITAISKISSGDLRRALNTFELLTNHYPDSHLINIKDLEKIMPSVSMAGFDKNGDYHYMYVSALQKSIRGSDPDAAIFYLTKLLEAGDIKSPARRLLVIASEDIGLAAPQVLEQTFAAINAAERLGLPEAYYPLSQAVLNLALAPKSNSIGKAFSKAKELIYNGYGTIVPEHINQEYPKNYLYPHNYPHHWVKQSYLPNDIKDVIIYDAGNNPIEQNLKKYWEYIKKLDS